VLQNPKAAALSVRQIAAHLGTRHWNITNELCQGARNQPGRLRGVKVTGPGTRGAGGQWRVDRSVYLDWLGVPQEDRAVLGADGLPVLHPERAVCDAFGLDRDKLLLLLLRNSLPHVAVGQRRYLTHHQMERLRVLLAEDCREKTR
jgi:hypothetical protein